MTTEKMTVHKALAELKVIGDRIDRAISQGVYCKTNKHSNDKINGVSIDEFKKQIQASWNKSNDLISRRNAIKRAVVLSNAKTMVKVGDKEMTVAEAIEMKNTGMEYKRNLWITLGSHYSTAITQMNMENGDALTKKAENYVIGLYGSKEGKTNNEELEKVRKEFIANNSLDFVDPIKVKDKIEELEKEISDFESEIDASLSVSNAITEVEIEY